VGGSARANRRLIKIIKEVLTFVRRAVKPETVEATRRAEKRANMVVIDEGEFSLDASGGKDETRDH
jgi:hypothetical protein